MSTVTMTPSAERLRKWIGKIALGPEMRERILARSTVDLRSQLEIGDRLGAYPQAGPWNSAPGTRGDDRWYQRKFGPRYYRKDKSFGGRNTSQNLQESWRIEKRDASASVYTEVTYAPLLLDAQQRVSWAAGHDWATTDEIVTAYEPRFEQIVMEEIDRQANTTV